MIEDLDLNIRNYNSLRRVGITEIRQLERLSDAELKAIPNIGNAAIEDIRDALMSHRLIEELKLLGTKPISLYGPVFEILKRLKVDPNLVRKIEIGPNKCTLTIYRTDSNGSKYVDGDSAATEIKRFHVKTSKT